MIKKTVTYTDFNDKERTEDHYFHLSKSELIELELSHEGGLTTILPEMVRAQDVGRVYELFKAIILKSYGRRSDDGRNFIKNGEEARSFMTSPAFDQLFSDLTSSPEAAEAFIIGIVPKGILPEESTGGQEKKIEIPSPSFTGFNSATDLTKMSDGEILDWIRKSKSSQE